METMYICKHGNSVTIGDTCTGNTGLGEGHQFIDYSVKEAERLYRQRHGLEGVRFKHKRVGAEFFYPVFSEKNEIQFATN